MTFNENARHLEDYPGTLVRFEPPHFLHVRPYGCTDVLRVTPGHFKEEDTLAKLIEILGGDVGYELGVVEFINAELS